MKIFRMITIAPVFALGGLLATVVPAAADIVVTYNTTGAFSAGSTPGTVFTGSNSATVSYLGLSGIGCLSNPMSENCDVNFQGELGTFTSVIPNNSSLNATGQFTLTINQTLTPYASYPNGSAPAGSGTIGTVSFSGTLSMGTGPATGEAILTFVSPPSVVVQGVTYTLDDLGGPNLAANQLGIGPNQTVSLGALISMPAGNTTWNTPEPSFYGLMGAGLAGLVGLVIRRKRKQIV
jgi:hypothetical protein